jgi:glutamine---fructose-6-phosphate transaminase (isomerizing)
MSMFRAFMNNASQWRIHIGQNPDRLPERSIVLFPYQPDTLFCGLAGILVIKGRNANGRKGYLELFTSHAHSVKLCSLERILDRSIEPSSYLSPEKLQEFETQLYRLKQDPQSQWPLFFQQPLDKLKNLCKELGVFAEDEELLLEKNAAKFSTHDMETLTRSLIHLKDISWGLREDLLKNQEKILALTGKSDSPSGQAFEKYQRINFTLNALDRLEVRGRDSCGIQVALQFGNHRELKKILETIKAAGLYEQFIERCAPGDLWDKSIHLSPDSVIFTYKTALITGDLGDNTRCLRKSIRNDGLLHLVLEASPDSQMYLVHTRWASVGAINEANCHPVNNFVITGDTLNQWDFTPARKKYPYYGTGPWSISVVLNGDIDNYPSLKESLESRNHSIDSRVTTDTKIIPVQIEHYLSDGHDLKEAFRKALNDFEGSHAIAMQSNLEPGKVFLAQKGSGQTIYVGLCDNQYVFSSEIYGLVEETPFFIKMDGESERIPGDEGTKGQIFVLNSEQGNGLDGIEAMFYDGYPITLKQSDIQHAEITTRDIDRGAFPHYLIKEILDAPGSIGKTMRGKYLIQDDGDVIFNLDEEVVPGRIREALKGGAIRCIYVVGQGTAAIAGAAIAEALQIYLKGTDISIQARKASDLSGFCLDNEMSHCLVIAITQSGTTTDTNRAVSMAKKRGAHLIAIVNRRQSDITTKVDGVFYTSDGRDIEMSVASTKAFYSQITAGYILALFMAQIMGSLPKARIASELKSLQRAPKLMQKVIAKRESIKASAWDLVRRKKYWAVVGSGTNKVASDEIRIKLSELCYKTISSDIIEDKKHIDLSSEPLIIVCAAGSPDVVLDDIIKDVAIFHAHSSSVVVIADEGEKRFHRISESVIQVPRSSFPISVILNTLAGHIWGYYAACSLDAQSATFKTFRSSISEIMRSQEKNGISLYESIADRDLHRAVDDFSSLFNSWRRTGMLSTMSVETASDITLLLKYAVGKLPVEDFWTEFGEPKITVSPLDRLDIVLGKAVEELSRPVDAIRHQAKTVTVGTSRRVEPPKGIIFDTLEDLSFSVENIPAKGGITLKRFQDAIRKINGYTLYVIKGLDEEGKPTEGTTIKVAKKQGISKRLSSRFDDPGILMGSKKTIVRNADVYAGTGKSDDASIILIPLLNTARAVEHLLLLHVEFNDEIPVEQKKEILGEKFGDIENIIDEYNIPWKDAYLAPLAVKYLLGETAERIGGKIKKTIDAQAEYDMTVAEKN